MTSRVLLTLTAMLSFSALLSAPAAEAADLPPVKVSDRNKVPVCVTPGRLMAFVKDRNDRLDSRFDGIATEYMRHGEDLAIRWDIAFFQMLLETGNLAFGGDVKPKQNNFAGLGATGNGEPGESFKDVSHGVRAHLEHLLMYTGEKIANPVAERTRKVQEWGVLTEWQKSLKGPVTFSQVAKKWAPPARKYAADIEAVADAYMSGPCKEADPKPELVAAARKGLLDDAMKPPVRVKLTGNAPAPASAPAAAAAAAPAAATANSAGEEAARRSVDAAKSDGGQRSALGASVASQTAAVGAETTTSATVAPTKPFTLINPGKPAEEQSETTVAAAAPATPQAPAAAPATTKIAAAGPTAAAAAAPSQKSAKPVKEPAAKDAAAKEPAKCNVFTASYGGQKSVIIKVVAADAVNYTVLDVNEGAESRETEAYIAAYAKGGKTIGDFKSQTLALDKAFELCPEG